MIWRTIQRLTVAAISAAIVVGTTPATPTAPYRPIIDARSEIVGFKQFVPAAEQPRSIGQKLAFIFTPSVFLQSSGCSAGTLRVILLSGTSTTLDPCWNAANNTVDALAAGGGGGSGNNNAGVGGGGAGGSAGCYSASTNVGTLTANLTINYSIGAAGPANTAGGDAFICNATTGCANIGDANVVVGAKGGPAGGNGSGAGVGGTPGGACSTASGVGATKTAGGNGGTAGVGAGGGGGAPGPSGVGRTGGNGAAGGGSGGGGGSNGGSSTVGGNAATTTGGDGGDGRGGTGHGVHGNPGGNATAASGAAGAGSNSANTTAANLAGGNSAVEPITAWGGTIGPAGGTGAGSVDGATALITGNSGSPPANGYGCGTGGTAGAISNAKTATTACPGVIVLTSTQP